MMCSFCFAKSFEKVEVFMEKSLEKVTVLTKKSLEKYEVQSSKYSMEVMKIAYLCLNTKI